MIKNNAQLNQAEERLSKIRSELNEFRKNRADLSQRMLIVPLEHEEEKLTGEIREYSALRDLSFEDAINFVLNKHMLLDNIGDLLAKLRIAAKKTQSDLAEELGWEQSNLSRFESENYSSQTINKIVEYANALGVWLHVQPSFLEEIDTETDTPSHKHLGVLNAFLKSNRTFSNVQKQNFVTMVGSPYEPDVLINDPHGGLVFETKVSGNVFGNSWQSSGIISLAHAFQTKVFQANANPSTDVDNGDQSIKDSTAGDSQPLNRVREAIDAGN